MGLAASQARFLAITARRADCEFRSLQLAQQKMSLGRELSNATSEYERSLNATKLVWNASGGGDNMLGVVSNTVTALDYDVMMKPSLYNAYNAYVLTNPKGEIILTNKYLAAAQTISLNGAPANPTPEGYVAFVQALNESGVIGPTTYEAMTKNKYRFNYSSEEEIRNYLRDSGEYGSDKTALNTEAARQWTLISEYINMSDVDRLKMNYEASAGLGGAQYDKTANLGVNIISLMDQLDSAKYNLDLSFKSNGVSKINDNKYEADRKIDYDKDQLTYKSSNTTKSDESEFSNLTIGKLLAGNYAIEVKSGYGSIDQYVGTVIGKIAAALGGSSLEEDASGSSYHGLYTDSASYKALQDAYTLTLTQYKVKNTQDANSFTDTSGETVDFSNVNEFNSPVNVFESTAKSGSSDNRVKHGNGNPDQYLSAYNDDKAERLEVSISNIVRAFLTNYAQSLAGFKSGYGVAESIKDSNLVTNDLSYTYLLYNSGSVADNDTICYNDFYSQLYNQICTHGWVSNDNYQVDNQEYLENQLKNGRIFVSSLSADGHFYQTSYSDTEYIVAVKDNDAIARAEAKYNSTKSKLDNKEQDLDLQIKTLDMEIAAMNTEYDTVKNLINKNIDKTFNIFSGG